MRRLDEARDLSRRLLEPWTHHQLPAGCDHARCTWCPSTPAGGGGFSVSDRFNAFPVDNEGVIAGAGRVTAPAVRRTDVGFENLLVTTAERTIDSVTDSIPGLPVSWEAFWELDDDANDFGRYGNRPRQQLRARSAVSVRPAGGRSAQELRIGGQRPAVPRVRPRLAMSMRVQATITAMAMMQERVHGTAMSSEAKRLATVHRSSVTMHLGLDALAHIRPSRCPWPWLAKRRWPKRGAYESFWLPESHFAGEAAIPDPLMLLAAVSASTETIRLATTSYLLPLRTRCRRRNRVAVLDRLSGGTGDPRGGAGLSAGDVRRLRGIAAKTSDACSSGAWGLCSERGGESPSGETRRQSGSRPLPVQKPHPPRVGCGVRAEGARPGWGIGFAVPRLAHGAPGKIAGQLPTP